MCRAPGRRLRRVVLALGRCTLPASSPAPVAPRCHRRSASGQLLRWTKRPSNFGSLFADTSGYRVRARTWPSRPADRAAAVLDLVVARTTRTPRGACWTPTSPAWVLWGVAQHDVWLSRAEGPRYRVRASGRIRPVRGRWPAPTTCSAGDDRPRAGVSLSACDVPRPYRFGRVRHRYGFGDVRTASGPVARARDRPGRRLPHLRRAFLTMAFPHVGDVASRSLRAPRPPPGAARRPPPARAAFAWVLAESSCRRCCYRAGSGRLLLLGRRRCRPAPQRLGRAGAERDLVPAAYRCSCSPGRRAGLFRRLPWRPCSPVRGARRHRAGRAAGVAGVPRLRPLLRAGLLPASPTTTGSCAARPARAGRGRAPARGRRRGVDRDPSRPARVRPQRHPAGQRAVGGRVHRGAARVRALGGPPGSSGGARCPGWSPCSTAGR